MQQKKTNNGQTKSLDEIIQKNKKRKLLPKAPRTKNNKNNQNLKLPFEAPEPSTTYDYGSPNYTDENHFKHLFW